MMDEERAAAGYGRRNGGCPARRAVLRGVVLLMGVAGALMADPDGGQAEGADGAGPSVSETPLETNAVMAFDIAAQPLEAAIRAFVGVSGLQVLYETTVTTGRQSAPLRGEFAAEAALRGLLRGTGLRAVYTARDAFTLVAIPGSAAEGDGARSNRGLDLRRHGIFLGVAQAETLRMLCRRPLTRPGSYRMTLRLWIAPSGDVVEVKVAAPAAADVTVAVVETVRRLTFPLPPPADLPQPLVMTIAPPRSAETDDCALVPPPEVLEHRQ